LLIVEQIFGDLVFQFVWVQSLHVPGRWRVFFGNFGEDVFLIKINKNKN